MRINESQLITNASTSETLNAAERWLIKEAPHLTPERGVTHLGLPYVGLNQLIDGIEITTRFVAEEANGGSILSFHLRMRGLSFLGKIRNLGMLPARKHVRNASREQFSQIVEELRDSTGGSD